MKNFMVMSQNLFINFGDQLCGQTWHDISIDYKFMNFDETILKENDVLASYIHRTFHENCTLSNVNA